MDKVASKITVFFEDPFWVGVYERMTNQKLEAAKVIFGAEPKDHEVYDYFLRNWSRLRFSSPIIEKKCANRKINSKRMRRAINLNYRKPELGRKTFNRKKSEEEKQQQFELRRQKKKQKHKGGMQKIPPLCFYV
jgi:hypothetical protein